MEKELDINNYDLCDLLLLFHLDMDFTYEDLKSAKQIALKTHPDKSGLESKYFIFFSKAYKCLVKIFKYRFLRERQNRELHENNVYIPEKMGDEKKHYLQKLNEMSSKDFNGWFNETFEKTKVRDDELDGGYGSWLKSEEGIVEGKDVLLSEFEKEFEDQKKRVQSLIISKGVEEVLDNKEGGYTLSREKVDNYSSGLFSKLQYDDLRKVHVESIIPVTREDYENRERFVDVEAYKKHRLRMAIKPLGKTGAGEYLANREQITNNENTHRIYNMIKQDEEMERANKEWWGYVQQLENK
jgi:hypothetical protein